MKTILRIALAALSAPLLLASCSREEDEGTFPMNPTEQSPTQFNCYFADDLPLTRSGLNGEGRMVWNNGDRMALWSSQKREVYKYSGGNGAYLAQFTISNAEAPTFGSQYSRFYAFHPYSAGITSSKEGVFIMTVPGIQNVTEGRFDPTAFPFTATTRNRTSTELRFHCSCAFLVLPFNGKGCITSLTVQGVDGETLCGRATVTFDSDGLPVMEMTGDGREIKVNCGNGIELSEGADSLVVVEVPAGRYRHGFNVKVETSDSRTYEESVTGDIVLERNGRHTASALTLPMGFGTAFTDFSLLLPDGRKAPAVDLQGPTFTVCVPRGTDMSSLAAGFRHTGAKVLVGDKEQKDGSTRNDFTKAVTYTVESISGQTASYTVKVIDVDLPVVYVGTVGHEGVTDKVNWRSGSSFIVVDTDGTVTDYGSTGIRGRGNSSWNYKKKPYAIKFETRPQKQEPPKETLLGMPGHKRWCLISNCMGYYFGNIVGYEVGRRSTIEWSPHARYVELVLNGEHKGLYLLTEQIKIDKYRIPIKELDPDDIGEDKITGGYLLSYDTTMDEKYQFRSTTFNMPVMVKSPDDDDMQAAQFEYIRNYVNEMELSLSNASRLAARDYLNYLDVDSFIGAWMTKELAGRKSSGKSTTTDFVTPRSVYYYKDRGGKMKAGPCWDFDVHFLLHEPALYCTKCQYYGKLFSDPEYVRRTVELWPQFKENLLGNARFTSITDYVDSLYNTIAYSAERDTKMWGKWSSTYPPYDAATQRDRMKDDLTQRIQWMDTQINQMKY